MPSDAPRRKPYASPALSMLGALLDVLPVARRQRLAGDRIVEDVS